jgi:cytidyltransferase-like protein
MLGGGGAAAAKRLGGRSLSAMQRRQARGLGSAADSQRLLQEPVRVLCNGVWDMFHTGHANAWLQAKLCTGAPGQDVSIVVALHDSEDVHEKKGRPTVFDDAERRLMANGCKWVDETVPNVPYDTITEKLIDTHGALTAPIPFHCARPVLV